MLIIGNKKFAKNDKEFTSSLFDKTGTCSGFYEKRIRSGLGAIIFKDMQGKVFAAIVNNKHGNVGFIKAHAYEGKIRYMYGINKAELEMLGADDLEYIEEMNLSKAVFNQALSA